MKHKLQVALVAGISAATLFSAAHAADGTITFTGRISASTCTIAGDGGSASFTVALPTVSASTLSSTGKTAGRTPFTIVLSGCSPTTGTVHTFFESGATTDTASGRLNLSAAAAGSTNATNVQIQLLNSDASIISAGSADSTQNSLSASIASGSATLRYFAQYYATGAATAGGANTLVTYTMSYQ
ncbi:Major fimbrial subunit SMF-1 [Paraburkholderia aspalathi]|uniref:fimbrial protein n=1 Tax=Paraburkholderia aspalathi TaxID=1324617 RepID=UPI00190B0CC3|nr:fimbrial protein [Paraburkholderia aspalathi]MBK3844326.1 type 1 fimbrial protein [Paraburkholderia aspalathi]CAE6871110.1 Major fimbrial subunit SMF-1 [Paraburkholderia aspalathi]